MTTFTRKNAWNQNGTFNNPDLLWYAKAVGVMQARSLNDPTSWWFFAAMHGQDLANTSPRGWWVNIQGPPNVPITPLPSNDITSLYWKQCQHGTWYFAPWHRGYLYAIENILRAIITNLEGPDDWALPYWNYFGPDLQYQMPPAFAEQTLPDGSPNPLLVNARYGPTGNKSIFIPLTARGITQECQTKPDYIGQQPNYYGGEKTGFSHEGRVSGALEWNPHNQVHGAIGGQNPVSGRGGLMSNPTPAALDPIFYLHHCNIDRMWAVWNNAGNSNPIETNWLKGPTATADRKFYAPKPDGSTWQYTPEMVNDTVQLDYTYYDLLMDVAPAAVLATKSLDRLRTLAFIKENDLINFNIMKNKTKLELVGANAAPLKLDALGVRTNVRLDTKAWNTVNKSLNKAFKADFTELSAKNNLPDEVYLQLEGVKGQEDSIVCSVSVNNYYAGHISLFGLQNASTEDNEHGGSGLTINLDITKIVDKLHLTDSMDVSSLDVLIQPVNKVANGDELTIERISVYRSGK